MIVFTKNHESVPLRETIKEMNVKDLDGNLVTFWVRVLTTDGWMLLDPTEDLPFDFSASIITIVDAQADSHQKLMISAE